MTDPLKQFLDVQITVAKLLAQQTEVLIKEGSNVVQQAVSTAADMHNSGINFLREVLKNKTPDGFPDSPSSAKSTGVKASTSTNASTNSFDKDRQGFSD